LTSSAKPTIVSHSTAMMGTFVDLKVSTPPARADEARAALSSAVDAMEEFIAVVSSWDSASDTSLINAHAGEAPVAIDKRLVALLQRAHEIAEISDGAFDVTFSPVGRLWRLRPENPKIPDDRALESALKLVDYRDLVVDAEAGTAFLKRPEMRIDLGAIAKGAVVDIAVDHLKAKGFPNLLVNAGGDLRASGAKANGPWVVAITAPRGPRNSGIGNLEVRDQAVTTSGDYEKMVTIDGKRYHHILDTKTGRPAEKSISVTVIAPNAERADALSTAFFVLGPVEGLALCERLADTEALFITPDFDAIHSSGFPIRIQRRAGAGDGN